MMVCKISLDTVSPEGSAGSIWNLRLVGSIWFGGSMRFDEFDMFSISVSII